MCYLHGTPVIVNRVIGHLHHDGLRLLPVAGGVTQARRLHADPAGIATRLHANGHHAGRLGIQHQRIALSSAFVDGQSVRADRHTGGIVVADDNLHFGRQALVVIAAGRVRQRHLLITGVIVRAGRDPHLLPRGPVGTGKCQGILIAAARHIGIHPQSGIGLTADGDRHRHDRLAAQRYSIVATVAFRHEHHVDAQRQRHGTGIGHHDSDLTTYRIITTVRGRVRQRHRVGPDIVILGCRDRDCLRFIPVRHGELQLLGTQGQVMAGRSRNRDRHGTGRFGRQPCPVVGTGTAFSQCDEGRIQQQARYPAIGDTDHDLAAH